MDPLLRALGVLFLLVLIGVGILIILAIAWFWMLKRRLGNAMRVLGRALQDAAIAEMPPTIHLRVTESVQWSDPAFIGVQTEALLALGFHDVGHYVIDEFPEITLAAFANPSESIWAVITDRRSTAPWCELVSYFTDQTSLTLTNNPGQATIESLPGHPKIFENTPFIEGLYRRFLKERPNRPRQPLIPGQFAQVYEAAYAQEIARRQSGTRGNPINVPQPPNDCGDDEDRLNALPSNRGVRP